MSKIKSFLSQDIFWKRIPNNLKVTVDPLS